VVKEEFFGVDEGPEEVFVSHFSREGWVERLALCGEAFLCEMFFGDGDFGFPWFTREGRKVEVAQAGVVVFALAMRAAVASLPESFARISGAFIRWRLCPRLGA
jgi:hypothetical protein